MTPISLSRWHFRYRCGPLPISDQFLLAVASLLPSVSQMLRTTVRNSSTPAAKPVPVAKPPPTRSAAAGAPRPPSSVAPGPTPDSATRPPTRTSAAVQTLPILVPGVGPGRYSWRRELSCSPAILKKPLVRVSRIAANKRRGRAPTHRPKARSHGAWRSVRLRSGSSAAIARLRPKPLRTSRFPAAPPSRSRPTRQTSGAPCSPIA